MIFIGDGALVRRAVTHAAARGHAVDLVCCEDPGDAAGAPHLAADVNTRAADLARASTDGIVWSLNNRRILRAPVLSLGLRILNIHNGLLPRHRGLPSVALLFALLHGDTEYGATLHEVDAGIDTGRVLADLRFPIGPDDRHHQVMLRGIRACQALFEETLAAVVAGSGLPAGTVRPYGPRTYNGLRALEQLSEHRDHPAFARATDLGPFAVHAPEVARAVAAVRGDGRDPAPLPA
ncbi:MULTISPECIES: formyltransferase family protein [unclassified Streptomyces]|uniref:formyltransferase family protein n=1 Tax=unclassified Streptomyces TaxID=2593676 RepID=UPI00226E8B12|nr:MULTISPECIES: formyltransferase family protein [unclassified Streptomyces]MCY0920054.1 formyltransferase family protein [Streptomyces sp. H27-G5]MCY0955471.1 formyltransferase family protein [Streptomyces sp. H27-H5]